MDCVGRALKAPHSFETGLYFIALNVSLTATLRPDATTACNAAFVKWDAFGGFPTTFAALETAAIWRPSRSIRSRLLTALLSSGNFHRDLTIIFNR